MMEFSVSSNEIRKTSACPQERNQLRDSWREMQTLFVPWPFTTQQPLCPLDLPISNSKLFDIKIWCSFLYFPFRCWALTRRGLIFSGSILASFIREPFSIRSWMTFLRLQLCEDCRSHLSTLVSSLLCYAQKPLCHVIFTLSPGSVLNHVKGF